jgi:hypothetical protein
VAPAHGPPRTRSDHLRHARDRRDQHEHHRARDARAPDQPAAPRAARSGHSKSLEHHTAAVAFRNVGELCRPAARSRARRPRWPRGLPTIGGRRRVRREACLAAEPCEPPVAWSRSPPCAAGGACPRDEHGRVIQLVRGPPSKRARGAPCEPREAPRRGPRRSRRGARRSGRSAKAISLRGRRSGRPSRSRSSELSSAFGDDR